MKEYSTRKYIKYVQISITCPNIETADKISTALVNRKLVSCVQITDTIKSVYLWNWKIEKNHELILTAKTRARYFLTIEKTVKELHPYTTPEIIALPIIKWSDEYLRWIDESLWLKTVDFKDNVVVKKEEEDTKKAKKTKIKI